MTNLVSNIVGLTTGKSNPKDVRNQIVEEVKKDKEIENKLKQSVSGVTNTIKKVPSVIKKNWQETAPAENPNEYNLGGNTWVKVEDIPKPKPQKSVQNKSQMSVEDRLKESVSGVTKTADDFIEKLLTPAKPNESMKDTFSGSLLYGLQNMSSSVAETFLNSYTQAKANVRGALAAQNTGEATRNIVSGAVTTAFAPVSSLFSGLETAVGGKDSMPVRFLETAIKTKDDIFVQPAYKYIEDNLEKGSSSAGFANTAVDLFKIGSDLVVYHKIFKAPSDIVKGVEKVPEKMSAFMDMLTGEPTKSKAKVVEYVEKTVNEMKVGERSFQQVVDAVNKPVELKIRKRNFVEWFRSFWESKLPPEIMEGTPIGEVIKEMSEPKYDLEKAFDGAMEVMGQNFGSVSENRMVGLKGMEDGKLRPGIEKPAPLPETPILEKEERMGYLKEEVNKRLATEEKIKTGEYEVVKTEELQKVRKSGGITMGIIKLADKAAGAVTSNTVKYVGKIADKITDLPKLKEWKEFAKQRLVKLTPQAGLKTDVYKALENYRKGQNREFKSIMEALEPLKELTKDKEVSTKAFQYLSGEKVEISSKLKEVLDPIRDEIDIEGLRQVMIGNLPEQTFYANMGRYMRRLYASHQLDAFNPLAESYKNLKNAFKKKGLSEVEAEEAIVGIMTKNLKDKYKGLLPPGIKTGGEFQKKRKLGNDELSLAIRDFLGEVQDPQYIIGRTLFDMKRSRLNYELLNELSNSGAVKETIPTGEVKNYKKLDGKEWGNLDGKYMEKSVFDYMKEMRGTDEVLGKTLTKLNNFIKANLTVRNPAGQFRNFTSNFATSQAILGHNYLSPSGMKDLYKSFESLKNKDSFYQELKEYGRLSDTGIRKELGERIEEVFKETQETGSNFIKTAKKIDSFLGKSYEAGDNLFLMANYKKLRAKGLKPFEAIKEASRVTPDYGEIAPIISKWRKSIIGAPFITWRYKVYPEILKEIIKSPIKGTLPIWFPWIVGNLVASQLGLTDSEKEVFKTRLYRDGRIPTGRSENGDVVYFDYGQYTPYADLFKGRNTKESSLLGKLPEQLEGYVKGSLPAIGSFPIQLFLEISQNYDPFTSKPISYEDSWTPEWGWDMAAHVAPDLLPIIGLSVNDMNKVANGDMMLSEALVKSATGLKIEPNSVGKYEKQETYNRPGFSLNKDRMDVYDTVKEIAKIKDKEESRKMMDGLYKKYPEQKEYIADRVRYERDKVTGKSKKQDTISTEVVSLTDVAKVNRELANKRLRELYSKYPEYKEYISKKVKEAKENYLSVE